MKLNILLILLTLFISSSLLASVAAVKNEDGSFKLEASAEKILGVEFKKLSANGPWMLPKSSLVKLKFSTGVYRRYEGNLTFVLVTVLKTQGDLVLLESQDLESGDEVAIKGAQFLRLTEADLNSGTVDNCAH